MTKFSASYTIIFLTTAVTMVTLVTGRSVQGQQCGDISVEQTERLRRDLMRQNSRIHWSFWLLPYMRASLSQHQIFTGRQSSHYSLLHGQNTCPNTVDLSVPVECPVYYSMQHDQNRIPENLVHARCACADRCSSTWTIPCYYCRPVYTYTWVYRRQDCRYVRVLEAIPIACTSAVNVRRAAEAPGN